jgi:hypothetical protein
MRLPLNLNIAPFRVTGKSSRPSPGRLARARQKKAPLKPAPAAAPCYSVEPAAGPGSEGVRSPLAGPAAGVTVTVQWQRAHHTDSDTTHNTNLQHHTQHQPTVRHQPASCPTQNRGATGAAEATGSLPGPLQAMHNPASAQQLRVTSRGPATHVESRLAQRAPKCH